MLKPFMRLLGVMALMFVTAPQNAAATKAWLLKSASGASPAQAGVEAAPIPYLSLLEVGTGARDALCAVQHSGSW